MNSSLLHQQCSACPIHLEWFVRWEVNGCIAAVLWGVASWICSKQHIAFLCSPYLAFSPYVLLMSRWCIHTVVLTQPQLGRNPVLFFAERSDFHMIDNLSIAVHPLAMHMLPLFSVDEILLPRYVNLSTNFKGLPLKVKMVLSCVKYMNFVLFAFI